MTRIPLLPASAIFVLFSALAAFADGPQTATLDGRVLDARGVALAGITIQLEGPEGRRTSVTDDRGSYRFALLSPGSYRVEAAAEGLGSAAATTLIGAGRRQRIDLELSGGVQESITARPGERRTNRLQQAATSVLDGETIRSVAYATRNSAASVRQLPGVVVRFDADTRPSLGGGVAGEAGIFLEGVDVSANRRGGELWFFIPSTAVAEHRLETAGFGVEYGRSTSAILSTTLASGTADVEGRALYIAQSPKWRAAYRDVELPRPDDRIDSFELSVGAPLIADRAWLFAALGRTSDNRIDRMRDGSVIDTSRESDSRIAKLSAQPTGRQRLAVSAVDVPTEAVLTDSNPGDVFALSRVPIDLRLLTATWSFGLSDEIFLEVKAATKDHREQREPLMRHPIAAGASPDDPDGNNHRYLDLQTNSRWNGVALADGEGFDDDPRDQANATLSLFRGDHELELGLDAQEVKARSSIDIGAEFRGRGFRRDRPGGFAQPILKRVYRDAGEIVSSGRTASAFVQERWTPGRRWSLVSGLRYDRQRIDNDVGERVHSSGDLAPRLAAVYDVWADGRLLARATVGRYVRAVPLDIATREFARLPNGANVFDELGWNAQSGRYDRFLRRSSPSFDTVARSIDPNIKDELSLGADWQLAHRWVATGSLIWSELDDLYWSTDQFDDEGAIVRDVRNWSAAYRRYRGATLSLNGSFARGARLRFSYTRGRADGNMASFSDDDDLFEALGGVEAGTGATDATIVHRDGRTNWDRSHLVDLTIFDRWSLGAHELGMGLFVELASGERWGRRPFTTIVHPTSGQRIITSTYREPRDARQLEDTFSLNLSADWTFPLRSSLRGRLGVELTNLTDEQEVVRVNIINGRPVSGIRAYQLPRELRVVLGIEF